MAWIDLVIVGIVAWSTFSAFRAGLIRQTISLFSVVVGGIVAARLYGRLAANIDFMVNEPQMRNLVSFVAIFAGFVVLGQLGAILAKFAAGMLFLGPLDHIGGAVFGFVQGVLSVAFLMLALTAFPAMERLTSALSDSKLTPILLERLPLLEGVLPQEFREALPTFKNGLPLPSLPTGLPGIP